MTNQYLALVARTRKGVSVLHGMCRSLPDWDISRPGPNIALLTDRATRRLTWDDGLILGSLFSRSSPKALEDLPPHEQRNVAQSRGQCLIDRFWGGYVALLPDGEQLSIVRAPFGELPCYWAESPDIVAIGSDVKAFGRVGIASRVDWTALGRRLAHYDHLGSETCLAGIQELRGGNRLILAGRSAPTVEQLWSPWTFADQGREFVDVEEVTARIRDVTRLSVAARTDGHAQLVLLLSGGLDSSIVAACLAHARRKFSCVTLFTDDASGDESRYAELVASSLRVPLRKERRETGFVDIYHSMSPDLPRPTTRSFEQESMRLAYEAARATGATAIVDGGGGDNVFNNHLSVAPVADRWLRDGPSPEFWSTVNAIAQLSQTSTVTVARRGILRALRPPKPASTIDLRYLSKTAGLTACAAADHPWIHVPSGIPPGKASYVSGLIPAQGLIESTDPRSALPSLCVLLTQPLIETCLRAPSWMWFEPDQNRALARRAFAHELPPAIIKRVSKGNPGGFIARIYETRHSEIASFLRDGNLRAHGLLDDKQLDRTLAVGGFVRNFDYLRIMQLVDAEAWAGHWA